MIVVRAEQTVDGYQQTKIERYELIAQATIYMDRVAKYYGPCRNVQVEKVEN